MKIADSNKYELIKLSFIKARQFFLYRSSKENYQINKF